MASKFSGPRFAIAIMSAGLISCSADNGDRQENPAPPRVFGTEDKRIAQSLSVGSRSLLDTEQAPYDRAVLCKVSVDSITPQLSASLDAEQSAAIDAARKALAQRLRAAATELGKSRSEIAQDIAKHEENADAVTQARLAIACLRDLTS